MKLLIAEHQPQIISALHLLIGQEKDITLVGDVHSSELLMDTIKEESPHILLLNWELPLFNPFLLLPRIKLLYPSLFIVAISGRPETRGDALALGVDLFFHRFERVENLLESLRGLPCSKTLHE